MKQMMVLAERREPSGAINRRACPYRYSPEIEHLFRERSLAMAKYERLNCRPFTSIHSNCQKLYRFSLGSKAVTRKITVELSTSRVKPVACQVNHLLESTNGAGGRAIGYADASRWI